MSLINDMLRDLEQRKEQDAVGTLAAANVSPAANLLADRKPYLLAGTALILLVCVGGFFAGGRLRESVFPQIDNEFAQTPVPVVMQSDQPAKDMSGSEHESGEQTVVPAFVESTQKPVSAEAQAVVVPRRQTLSRLAISNHGTAASMTMTFARRPEYELVRQDLDQRRFLIRVNEAIVGEDLLVPEEIDGVISDVSIKPQASALLLMIDFAKPVRLAGLQVVEEEEHSYSLVLDVKADKQPQKRQGGAVEKPLEPAAIAADSTPEPAVSEAAVPPTAAEVQVSKKQPVLPADEAAFTNGVTHLAAGEIAVAEDSFLEVLRINPQWLEARLHLADIYLQLQTPEKAEKQLLDALKVEPENLAVRKRYARLLLRENRQSEALFLLEKKPRPLLTEDLEYYALFAALLQENERYAEAVAVYRDLVLVKPDNGLWWFGMGLSADQAGQPDVAQRGYRTALNRQGLRNDLAVYAQQRMNSLQTQ